MIIKLSKYKKDIKIKIFTQNALTLIGLLILLHVLIQYVQIILMLLQMMHVNHFTLNVQQTELDVQQLVHPVLFFLMQIQNFVQSLQVVIRLLLVGGKVELILQIKLVVMWIVLIQLMIYVVNFRRMRDN
ncbi:unnamed protein product [Paramecium sonneborni]|uniref:Transmembrane protein n=1 Tax=Paramecium sonneborni TaxID=65129 RepID=A0A8S1RQU6_9CILI|nr:unnamed protein product [Paramecium sonneborni]